MASFLGWAHQRGHTPNLAVTVQAPPAPTQYLDDDVRWQLARQALTDSTWTVSDRVAACLVLVYGQSLSRIVVLTTASIGTTPDGAPEDTPAQELTLTLAKDPITIPGPLANLIRQLPEPKAGFAATIDNANPWLFPGARAGQHITRGNLSWRMNRLGIRPGPAATAPCYTWPARCPRP